MEPLPAPGARPTAARMKEQLGAIILTTFGNLPSGVLADLVRVEHDEAMTRQSLAGEIPFGEALRHAGAGAKVW